MVCAIQDVRLDDIMVALALKSMNLLSQTLDSATVKPEYTTYSTAS